MGNVIQPAVTSSGLLSSSKTDTVPEPDQFVEDFAPQPTPGEERRVRFQNTDHRHTDTHPDHRHPHPDHGHSVVVVKANENRSSASSSGYESKSCSSIDSDIEVRETEDPLANVAVSPLYSSAVKAILTCDECGLRFSKSGLYLTHIRTRSHLGCESQQRIPDQTFPSPQTLAKSQLADSIRKTKSYNQERDLLWVAPEKLRPKSARPEHRILGPLGNSYLHWLSHLERLDQLSDESSETVEDRSPPSTGESTLC